MPSRTKSFRTPSSAQSCSCTSTCSSRTSWKTLLKGGPHTPEERRKETRTGEEFHTPLEEGVQGFANTFSDLRSAKLAAAAAATVVATTTGPEDRPALVPTSSLGKGTGTDKGKGESKNSTRGRQQWLQAYQPQHQQAAATRFGLAWRPISLCLLCGL